MSQAPKFLVGGINKWNNFGGLYTCWTAAYGWVEVFVKAAPAFAFIYGVRKYLSHFFKGLVDRPLETLFKS